jgi:hypothetical protein
VASDDVEIIGSIKIDDQGNMTLERLNQNLDETKSKTEEAGTSTGLFGGIMEHVGSIADFAIGGIVKEAFTGALEKIGEFTSSFIEKASESEIAAAHLGAVIQSTGGAAGYTKEQALALGEQFKDLAGGSHETVDAAEAVLMRFTNIGHDAFPVATKAALDLAAATGMDATNAAQMLGKALEDPATGLARLKRYGIDFTEAQKEQIKAMEKAGNIAGAQQIVLDRLAVTTGGQATAMAQTFTGRMEIMHNRIGEVVETIGNKFLPLFEPMITAFTNIISKIVEWVANSGALDSLGNILKAIGDTVGAVIKDLMGGADVGVVLDDIHEGLFGLVPPEVIDTISNLVKWVSGSLLPTLSNLWSFIQTNLQPILYGLAAVLGVIGVILIGTLISAIGGIVVAAAPVILVIGGIIAAVALLTTAWKNDWGGIQEKVHAVMAFIEPIFQRIVVWFQANLPIAINFLTNLWKAVLLPAIQIVWNFVQTSLLPLLESLANFLGAVLGLAITVLTGLWQNVLLPALTTIANWIGEHVIPGFHDLVDALSGPLSGAITAAQPLLQGIQTIFDDIGKAIGTVIGWIDTLTGALTSIKLPSWLMPGSATPFEIGLTGIAKALGVVNAQMSTFNNNSQTSSVFAPNYYNSYSLAVQQVGSSMDLVGAFNSMRAQTGMG